MSVAQAMGRLRPKQRKSNGCIEIYLNTMSQKRWKLFEERDEKACRLLVDKGILVTAEHQKSFRAVGTLHELYRWAVTDPGCRIVALSNRFGLRGVSNCKACDRCRGTPVAKTAVVAKRKAATDTTSENKALQVLRRLESVCMFCNSDLCNGETCLGPRACYKCGAKHFSKDCNADLKAVLENRACYQCLDLHSRRNYQSHEIQKCPLKKRLRRMLIEAWRNDGTKKTFVCFVASIMCDKEHFYRFLATNTTNNK
jgi:superfamily II DNA helicase RecQ